jgi:hypothetical protein
MNIPMPKELTLRTLAKRVAWLKKVWKIEDNFQMKWRRGKIQIGLNGLRWNLEIWVLVVYKWQ